MASYARHLDQEIAESEDGAEGSRVFKGETQAGLEREITTRSFRSR
jgi:hypothetical protein